MEALEERELLYYERCTRMPKHYNGAPILHYTYRNVKTGENVALGYCMYGDEVSELGFGYYYDDITKAEEYFDILWSVSGDGITPIPTPFEMVQERYKRLLSDGVPADRINAAIMEEFGPKKQR